MTDFTLRMFERIIGVIIGGMSIYLGYSLFKLIPQIQVGEGKITFPGGSVHLFRTGPGVFFALFGCAIVYFSFTNAVWTGVSSGAQAPTLDQRQSSEESVPSSWESRVSHGVADEELISFENWIKDLNQLSENLEAGTALGDFEKEEAILVIEQAKLAFIRLMLNDPFHPDFAEFRNDVRAGRRYSENDKWYRFAQLYYKQ